LLFKRKDESLFKFIPPFRMLSKKWYEWARRENAMLKNVSDLSKLLQDTVGALYRLGRIERYNWTRKRIESALISNLTYPLFLLFTGVNKQPPRKLKVWIPKYDMEELKPLVREDIEKALVTLKGGPLSKLDKKFAREFVETSTDKMPKKISAAYPSNEFVLSMVSKMLGLHLNSFYGRYSYFVHSYDSAWQLFPFSSVLEFKILKYELSSFFNTISETMRSYFNEIPGRGNRLATANSQVFNFF